MQLAAPGSRCALPSEQWLTLRKGSKFDGSCRSGCGSERERAIHVLWSKLEISGGCWIPKRPVVLLALLAREETSYPQNVSLECESTDFTTTRRLKPLAGARRSRGSKSAEAPPEGSHSGCV